MKKILVSYLIYFATVTIAYSQDWDWSLSQGGDEIESLFEVELDANNNIYMVGAFQTTVDFDPGASVNDNTSQGSFDGFVQKLDQNGIYQWHVTLGGFDMDYCRDIAIDNMGNSYVVGSFRQNVDCETTNGTITISSNGWDDLFVLKINNLGIIQWVYAVGSSNSDYAHSLCLDSQNNLIITGRIDGNCNFDPGVSDFSLTPNGISDAFILKLTENGDFLWATNIGGSDVDSGTTVARDSQDDIYLTGTFRAITDLDPGPGLDMHYGDGVYDDGFIVKLSSNGNFIWGTAFSGDDYDWPHDIKVSDLNNSVYVGGRIRYTVVFDSTDIANSTITSNGDFDAFILSLDLDGNFNWVKNYGGTSADLVTDIQSLSDGSIFISGIFTNQMDVNPENGGNLINSNGGTDAFALHLNQNSNYQNVYTIGGVGNELRTQSVVNSTGVFYTAGDFQSNVDFSTSTGTITVTSNGLFDIYLGKRLSLLDLDETTVPERKLVKVTNLLGQKVVVKPNTILIYKYSDGTIEKVVKVE